MAVGDSRQGRRSHAFKRARGRLQNQVRRMQGHVKTHQQRPVGTETP
jgi:hypothetical protein